MAVTMMRILWYIVGLALLVLTWRGFGQYVWHPADSSTQNLIDGILLILALVGIIIFFVMVDAALRAIPRQLRELKPVALAEPTGFPGSATLIVSAWIVVSSVVSIIALMVVLIRPEWLMLLVGSANPAAVLDAIIVMSAAAVGGNIATILGFLLHASEKKNFDLAYLPWYFARPLMAALLGLVFFLLLRGGLLMVTVGPQGGEGAPQDLSDLGLAGIGGLVGMFSKNAVEKLREVFGLLFATQKDFEQQRREDQERVVAQLPDEMQKPARRALGMDTREHYSAALAATLRLSRTAIGEIRELPDDFIARVRAQLKITESAEVIVLGLNEPGYLELLKAMDVTVVQEDWLALLPETLQQEIQNNQVPE